MTTVVEDNEIVHPVKESLQTVVTDVSRDGNIKKVTVKGGLFDVIGMSFKPLYLTRSQESIKELAALQTQGGLRSFLNRLAGLSLLPEPSPIAL